MAVRTTISKDRCGPAPGVRRRSTVRRCWLLPCLLLASLPALADTWWEARQGDYHLVSQLSRKQTAKVARDLQVFQVALKNFFPQGDLALHQPVTILLLDDKLWRRYVTDSSTRVGLAYRSDEHCYVLANGDAWLRASNIVFHELTHVFLHKNFNGKGLPVWLDEGYADLMSTVESGKDYVKVGVFPLWRYYSLRTSPWMPLRTILRASRTSPEYAEDRLAAAFYAQSWLLTHYNTFSAPPERKAQFDKYLALLGADTAADEALAEAFSGDVSQLEEELQRYSRSTAFKYAQFPAADLAGNPESKVSELPEAAAKQELAGWMLKDRRLADDAMQFLEQQARGAAPESTEMLQLAVAQARNDQGDLAKPRLEVGCAAASGFRANMLCGDGYGALGRIEPGTQEERVRQARRFYMEALSLDPQNSSALIRASSTYRLFDGDSAVLVSALQQALARDKYNSSLAAGLALVLQHTDLAQARSYLARAIANASGRMDEDDMVRLLDSMEKALAERKEADAMAAKRAAVLAAPPEVRTALEKLAAQDLVQADKLLKAIVNSPGFAQLNAAVRHEVLSNAGVCALRLRDAQRAHELLKRAVELDPEQPQSWYWLVYAAIDSSRFGEAADAATQVAQRWPKVARQLVPHAIIPLARSVRGTPQWRAMAQALFKAQWQLENEEEPENLWRELALVELEQGATSMALEVTQRIRSPSSLVMLAADKRFDSIVAAAPERFDLLQAMEREQQRLRTRHADKPRSLANLSALVMILNKAQKFAEAEQLAAPVVAQSSTELKAAYDDVEAQLSWLMNVHANSLSGQRRWSDAEAWLKRAAALSERAGPNVSQTINLAGLYMVLDRPREVRATLATVGSMSPFGRMQLERLQAQAAFALHDTAALEKSLRYMSEHHQDAPDAYVAALFNVNRRDEAARLVIERLRDPARRADALALIQDYTNPPTTPANQADEEAWDAFPYRPDIQAALLEVGHVLKVPFAR